jgi:hypothetical protein
MRNTLIVLFLTFLLININTFSQSGGNLNTNNVQVAFPFTDDAEDTTTSYANWDRDASQWQVKIVGARSGTQAWVMQQGTGSYNYITYRVE